MTGWFKTDRSLFDHEFWLAEPFTKAQAWIDLYGNARHTPGSFEVRGQEVPLERGQLGWSELTMSKRWKWSRGKVRRYLGTLTRKQMIVQQTSILTTVITICNYERFQYHEKISDTTNGTADRTTDGQQTVHKQEGFNGKKVEEVNKSNGRFAPPSQDEAINYFTGRGSETPEQQAESFIDFYQSKGWMVGKNKMKDWKAAVRNWLKRSNGNGSGNYKSKEQQLAKANKAVCDDVIAEMRKGDGKI